MKPDFTIQNEGSIVLVRPHNDNAAQMLDISVQDDAQYFGNALVVEPRYIEGFLRGLQEEGFTFA